MPARGGTGGTFRSLRVRNFRLYWSGQIVSQLGSMFSLTALSWMVLTDLGGNGTHVGFLMASQFVPTLVLGPFAGLLADRLDARRLLLLSQVLLMGLATFLAVLTSTGAIRLWMAFPLIGAQGVVMAFANPARQTFVSELVGPAEVANAVSLNSAGFNLARIAGPALAGTVIHAAGTGLCFTLNAVSFTVSLVGLLLVRTGELHPRTRAVRAKRQVREGLSHAMQVPILRTTLITMAVVGAITLNFSVLIPLLARMAFQTSAETFGLLSTAMGVGSFLGSMLTARSTRPMLEHQGLAALGLAAGSTAAAFSPNLTVAMGAVAVIGASSMAFLATTNSLLQVNARPDMRGRVLSLYLVLLMGTSPFGGPALGWVAEHFGIRTSYLITAGGAVLGAAISFRTRAVGHVTEAADPTPATPVLAAEGAAR